MNDPQCDSGFRVIPLETTTKTTVKITSFIYTHSFCTFLYTVKFDPMLKLNQYHKWGEKEVILAPQQFTIALTEEEASLKVKSKIKE